MRIGVLTTSYPRAATDPAGTFVAGLARWLHGTGAEVEVVAAGPGGKSDANGAIRVHRVDAPGLFYGGGAPEALARSRRAWVAAGWFGVRFAAVAAARARRWDALISHWLLPCGLVGAALARGRPHVAVAHSGDVHLLEQLPARALLARVLGRQRLVFVSADLKARFARLAPARAAAVLPMGTDLVPAPLPDPPARPFTVLALARLSPIKGIPVLLRAAAALPDVRFLIAGAGANDGPEAARLRAAAPAHVDMLGELRGADKLRALQEAHVVCVPSVVLPDGRTEGSPVVVAEALAAGRPLVASRTGGLPDAVGDAGLLVPPGDPVALAAALARLRDDRRLNAILAARARSRASVQNWSQIGPRILNLLHA